MKVKKGFIKFDYLMLILAAMIGFYVNAAESKALNPYLPQWEHIPDGEPYIFEDPENPGTYRVYVYGSHDIFKTAFCGDDLVVWSAPVDDLTNWRYDGVIFEYEQHTLYAPDIAVVTNEDGSKTYYLYPNDQNDSKIIAKSDSPTGPFEVCSTKGILGFDPAVFVDDDGRVYGYWGFQSSNMAELDPDTMCTVKDGCKVLTEADTGIDGSEDAEGPFRFFEASSMRKINDNGYTRYVLIYSRNTMPDEFGLWPTNATLAYAYSDGPLGPWTYGGTIIDARARQTDNNGNTIVTMQFANTHGSLCEINGQWFIFYHRCINGDMYSRQGTAEPVDVSINDAGEVIISEAEVTSQGLEINGLNPYKNYSAGILCYCTGSSYVKATYDEQYDGSPVCNNKNGGIIGYKYFNFNKEDWQDTEFELDYIGKGNDGYITLMLDSPWESEGGTEIGSVDINADSSTEEITTVKTELPELDGITGKHALYMVFHADNNKELADLYDFRFRLTGVNPVTPTPVVTSTPDKTQVSTSEPYNQTSSPAPVPAKTQTVKAGDKYTVGKFVYKVITTNDNGGTVSFAGTTSKKISAAVIKSSVTINGKSYDIVRIEKKAFAGCKKLKKIVIKTTKLKKVGASCFKGIHKKAFIKVPKKCYKTYVKLLNGKGQKKSVRIRR